MKPFGRKPRGNEIIDGPGNRPLPLSVAQRGYAREEAKKEIREAMPNYNQDNLEGCGESCPSCFPDGDVMFFGVEDTWPEDTWMEPLCIPELDAALDAIEPLLSAQPGTPEYARLQELTAIIEAIEALLYPERSVSEEEATTFRDEQDKS